MLKVSGKLFQISLVTSTFFILHCTKVSSVSLDFSHKMRKHTSEMTTSYYLKV
jgi:hypothetical protein